MAEERWEINVKNTNGMTGTVNIDEVRWQRTRSIISHELATAVAAGCHSSQTVQDDKAQLWLHELFSAVYRR